MKPAGRLAGVGGGEGGWEGFSSFRLYSQTTSKCLKMCQLSHWAFSPKCPSPLHPSSDVCGARLTVPSEAPAAEIRVLAERGHEVPCAVPPRAAPAPEGPASRQNIYFCSHPRLSLDFSHSLTLSVV